MKRRRSIATDLLLGAGAGANTVLGLTPPPPEFPWQAHVRGLVGHVVHGVATEAALQLTDGV